MGDDPDDAKLSNDQASELLGIEAQSLAALRMHGGGPHYEKIGRRVQYTMRAIREYQDQRAIRLFARIFAIRASARCKPNGPVTLATVTELYREKARLRHPDAGGSDTLMAELNVAYEEACRELGQ